jgi:transposase-like protein
MDNSHYGLWTVLGPGTKKDHLLCRCECGTEREVNRHSLERGLSRSCGCVAHAEGARKRRALPPDAEDRLAAEYVTGKSIKQLAREYGVSTKPVQRILKQHGIESRAPGRKTTVSLTDAEKKKLDAEYRAGDVSVADLAKRHGYPHAAVRNAIESFGGVRRRGPGAEGFDPDERREIARRFVEDGETQGALAEAFGCGIGTIIRVLRLEGVPAGAHGQKGERHHAWKGGKRLNENGYVMIRVDQNDEIGQAMGPQNGYLLESRLVMAHHLGRPLFPDEFVHHGPKGKQDNTIENLELWTTHHPKGQRVDELLEFAREIVTRYKDIEDKL